jgi:hypothetical protein
LIGQGHNMLYVYFLRCLYVVIFYLMDACRMNKGKKPGIAERNLRKPLIMSFVRIVWCLLCCTKAAQSGGARGIAGQCAGFGEGGLKRI